MNAALSRHIGIPLKYANRHGLITGQTGTGKTVTLQKLAESFSMAGVPVFISDVKGDIAALSRSCPTQFLDVFGQSGKPVCVPIRAMGADILARALELTDTQAGCLEIAFTYAAAGNFQLDTIDDMRRLFAEMAADSEYISAQYGQISKASIAVIMRALLRLEKQGGNRFFGNPQFDVADLLQDIWNQESVTNPQGLVSILQADRLVQSPRVYGAFLLWLLSDLYERLPEIGDMARPRLVFFFDEAHLLFQDANPALLRKVEQIARLIRSKGVGVYFVTQSPDDVPAAIREQLAHRIAHDRRLRVGVAHVRTMTADGRPWDMGECQIDLPACPLGALSEAESERAQPRVMDPAPAANGLHWERLGKAEIILLIVCLIALAGVGFGLYWLWFAGTLGRTAAIGFALAVAGVVKS